MKTYKHMTEAERARLIELGGKKQRYNNLTTDELIEFYELINKANKEGAYRL